MEEETYQATQDLVLYLVNHGTIDIRVWMRGNDYERSTKQEYAFTTSMITGLSLRGSLIRQTSSVEEIT